MSAKKGEYGTEFVTADKLAAIDLNEVYNMLAQGRYSEAMHRVKSYLARLGVFVFRADVVQVDVERGSLDRIRRLRHKGPGPRPDPARGNNLILPRPVRLILTTFSKLRPE